MTENEEYECVYVPPTDDIALKDRVVQVISTDFEPIEQMEKEMERRLEADEEARDAAGALCTSRMVRALMDLHAGPSEAMAYLYEFNSWSDGMVQLSAMLETEADMDVILQRDWLRERDGDGAVTYCVSIVSSVSKTITLFHSLDSWDAFQPVQDHALRTLREVASVL